MSAELVRRATELTGSDGQVTDDELAEIFSPEVVLDLRARIFNPAVYEGYDGLRQFYAESREVWEDVQLTIREIVEEGDRYLVLAEARSRARGSGIEVGAGLTAVWSTSHGRLSHLRLVSPTGAHREAGLAALRER